MSDSTPLRIAVIGGGGLIGVRHVDHVLHEPATEMASIVDPTAAGREFAAKNSVAHFNDLDELLASGTKIDAAIVATPNHTHIPLCVALVDADISVLVEKPLSTTTASVEGLLAATKAACSRRSPAKVLVGHHRRFNPYTVAAKRLLSSGSLGDVVAVQGTWATRKDEQYFAPAWRRAAGQGGPVLINLIHDIDIVRYLVGDIARVYAEVGKSTRGHPVEETVAVAVRFVDGAVGTFVVSDAAVSPWNWEGATGENPLFPKTGQNNLRIMGTQGSLGFPEMQRWNYDDIDIDASWRDEIQHDDSARADVIAVPPFTLQLQHFVEVVRGTAEPACSVEEGLKSLLVVEGILESMKTEAPVNIN